MVLVGEGGRRVETVDSTVGMKDVSVERGPLELRANMIRSWTTRFWVESFVPLDLWFLVPCSAPPPWPTRW